MRGKRRAKACRAVVVRYRSTEQRMGLASSASRGHPMRVYPLTDFCGRIYEIPVICRLIWWGLR